MNDITIYICGGIGLLIVSVSLGCIPLILRLISKKLEESNRKKEKASWVNGIKPVEEDWIR